MVAESAAAERLHSEIKRRRVFVLGAGFSAAAGVPMTAPLLDQAMGLLRRTGYGLYDRMESMARTCFGLTSDTVIDWTKIDLSAFCTFLEYQELREYAGAERWSDDGSREKLALRFYLSRAVAESTPDPDDVPPLYVDFASMLRPGDIVISFNWDALLENSLERCGVEYSYSVEPFAVALAKLHGSVNWRWDLPERATLTWNPVGLTTGLMPVDLYECPELRSQASWKSLSPLGEVAPTIVLPGFGKAYDVRRLAYLWYKPEFAFGFTHDVFVIGLALARDDFIVRSFMLDNLPYIDGYSGVPGRRIHVVNPDPMARGRYGFLVGRSNVEFHLEPFGRKHLELIRASGQES